MCQVVDDYLPAKAKTPPCVGKKCMKCEKSAVTTARTKDPFCKDCFNVYFVHRFRATFGKARLFTTGEKVLLAFSGGMNSRVLLGLAEEGLRLSAYKKLRFEPTVVVIDEGAVVGEKWSERCRQLSECLAIATATSFPTIYTRLEQVFGEYGVHSVDKLLTGRGNEGSAKVDGDCCVKSSSDSVGSNLEPNCDIKQTFDCVGGGNGEEREHAALQKTLYEALVQEKEDESLLKQARDLFASCHSVTAQENLLTSLRRQLLVEIARKQGYSKVLMGDTATRLAVRLLGNVAQGRGRALPLDTGFIDDRAAGVALIRPLREFPVNEAAMYARFNGLRSIFIPGLTTLTAEQASIERLTESFVAGLQVDFPSTVSTVFRTSDKLAVPEDGKLKKCSLCQGPTGPPADQSVFTHLSSADGCDPDLWTHLCYGCQLTVKDMNYDISSLPPFVQCSKDSQQQEAPSCIKEFLLDDSNS